MPCGMFELYGAGLTGRRDYTLRRRRRQQLLHCPPMIRQPGRDGWRRLEGHVWSDEIVKRDVQRHRRFVVTP
jgi:hypothetical protein